MPTASEHGPDEETYEFSLGDVPLLIPTPEVEAFIAEYLPLRQYFEQPYQPAGGWMSSANNQWPQTPELNTLYWPTGCTRWGFGVFLFSGENLSHVESAFRTNGTALLKMGDPDDSDHYIEAQVAPLCPIPVTGNSSESNEDDGYPLYLLPVVCKRYGAQFYGATVGEADFIPGDTFPMATALQNANNGIGGLVTTHLDALPDYFQDAEISCITATVPHNYHSAMQIAESAAWSCGLTLVMELDGSASFMHRDAAVGVDTNDSRLEAFRGKVNDDTFEIVAGYVAGANDQATLTDLIRAGIPVTFHLQYAGGAGEFEIDRFVVPGNEQTVTASEILGYAGQANHWVVTAPIVVPAADDDEDTDLLTEDDVHSLAIDVANEWYTQVANPIDATFAGICKIPLSAHTDIIEWHMGRRGPQTRVRSRRWNAFPNRLINQFSHGSDSQRGPRRWERVRVQAGEAGVTFNGKDYNASFPIQQQGFGQFDEGDVVNGGWDPYTKTFFIADQRPLDIDVLGPLIAQWLIDNNYIDDGFQGNDIDGGAL